MWTLMVLAMLGQVAGEDRPLVALLPPAGRVESAPPEVLELLRASAHAALEAEGFALLPPEETQARLGGLSPADCGQSTTCHGLLTERLEVPWSVRLDADAVEEDVAVLMEAFRAGSADSVRHLFVARLEALEEEAVAQAAVFAGKVRDAHGQQGEAVTDVPRRVELAPRPRPADPDLALAPERSRAPRLLATGGAVAAGAVAVVFAAVGASAQSCLQGPPRDGVPTVCVSQAEVAGVQRRARVGLAGAATSGVIAAALAATALLAGD